jgi:hypothetical protein
MVSLSSMVRTVMAMAPNGAPPALSRAKLIVADGSATALSRMGAVNVLLEFSPSDQVRVPPSARIEVAEFKSCGRGVVPGTSGCVDGRHRAP